MGSSKRFYWDVTGQTGPIAGERRLFIQRCLRLFFCNSFPLASGEKKKKSFVEDDVSQERVEFSNIFQGRRRNTLAALLH